MPEIIQTMVYRLGELPDAAKEQARTWYRERGFDHDWYEFVYADFEEVCAILADPFLAEIATLLPQLDSLHRTLIYGAVRDAAMGRRRTA